MADKGINQRGLARILADLKASFARLSHTHAAGDVTSGTFDAARIPNLSGTYAGKTHSHAAGDVTSGTFAAARLPDASSSSKGAMSAADKSKLDKMQDKVIRIPASGTMAVSAASSAANIASASDSRITANHEVVNAVISNPANQTSDWTVTTAAGSLTVNGTCFAATTLILYLARTN